MKFSTNAAGNPVIYLLLLEGMDADEFVDAYATREEAEASRLNLGFSLYEYDMVTQERVQLP
jgi:hypothetical protein